MIKTDYDSLDIKTSVSSDITLPVTREKDGSSIKRTSSNPAVIAADGKVTVPEAGAADVSVTLTAVLTNSTETMEKRFEVTVMAKSDFTARVSEVSVELGMSVQNKSGIWCKPNVRLNIMIDGGTDPKQREAIIKQAFDEVCDNIEKVISEME